MSLDGKNPWVPEWLRGAGGGVDGVGMVFVDCALRHAVCALGGWCLGSANVFSNILCPCRIPVHTPVCDSVPLHVPPVSTGTLPGAASGHSGWQAPPPPARAVQASLCDVRAL